MDWKKIAPWNWFKDEQAGAVPVHARHAAAGDPVEALRSQIDRVFEDAFRGFGGVPSGRLWSDPPLRAAVDISEGRKAYKIEAELPGVEEEDVSVEVEGHTLILRGEKRQEREEEDAGYHCVERSYGTVQRVLSLPEDADPDHIEAKFRHGVLRLRVPKLAASAPRGRRVEVQRG
jgi:HSP20 family protein